MQDESLWERRMQEEALCAVKGCGLELTWHVTRVSFDAMLSLSFWSQPKRLCTLSTLCWSTFGNLSEDVVKSLWNDAPEFKRLFLAFHSEGLATACLPIGKDGPYSRAITPGCSLTA